jgi:hypothetical protein
VYSIPGILLHTSVAEPHHFYVLTPAHGLEIIAALASTEHSIQNEKEELNY